MLDVCILGNSGMQPLPNRHLASAMFRYNGGSLLIDCGEGTQVAIKKQGWSFKSINTICLTHYHTDHISGLSGLLASMSNSEKTDTLTIIGPPGLEKVVNAALVMSGKLSFNIKLIKITEKSQSLRNDGFNIETFRCNHSVPCNGYTIIINRNGRCDIDKAAANDIPEELWSRLQKNEIVEHNGRILTKDLILDGTRKGIKVTYCTDTRPTDDIVKFAKNADLFICEGMYGDDENFENALKNKHMMFSEAAELAVKSNVRELWLTHYSPSIAHPKIYLDSTTAIFKNTVLTKCGMVKKMEFDK